MAHLKRDERESRMAKLYEERFMWALGLALGLLVLEAFLLEKTPRKREVAA